MTRSLLARQLPVDEWLLLPTPEPYFSQDSKATRNTYARMVRHILFDIGKGLFMNLSPEHHKIVIDQCRASYDRHIERRRLEGRTPMRFDHTGRGYVRLWKVNQKALYIQHDIPRKLKEYQKVA